MEKNRSYRFLGVSTKNSSVNTAFPLWMRALNQKINLENVDLPLNASGAEYIDFCKNLKSTHVIGALITSHKANIFDYGSSEFSHLSDDSIALREISAIRYDHITKKLIGHNTDIEGSKRSLLNLTDKNNKWLSGNKNIVILGAGGTGMSLISSAYRFISNFNSITVTEVDESRILKVKQILNTNKFAAKISSSDDTDDIIASSGRAPLIINATGVGKDTPGSPVSDISCFPEDSTFWELNYRGERELYYSLNKVKESNGFRIEGGWDFFIDGWMNNILFTLDINPSDEIIAKFRTSLNNMKNSS